MNDKQQFQMWEMATRDTIDFKRCYVDMAGDLVAGLLLSQIVFWHLPNSKTGQTKMRVKKGSHYWIAKKRTDWWEEIRITERQFDRAIVRLENRGLVATKLYRFGGFPTKHIRIKWDTFLSVFTQSVKSEFTQSVSSLTETTYKEKKSNSAFGLQASSVEDETKHEKKRKAKPARPQAILQIEDILGRTFDESLWSTIQDKITLPIDAVRLYQTFAFRMAEGYFPRDANKWMDDYATNAHYHRERNKEIFKYLGNEPANMPYHAAIRAMAEIIGYNPDWILHAAIVAAMEVAGGIDKPRLKQCYADWCARGYNKYNLEGWYFERYVQERPYAGIGE